MAIVPLTPDEIRDIRRSLGLTQTQLAERMELTMDAIASWEIGRTSPTGPGRILLRLLKTEAAAKPPPPG